MEAYCLEVVMYLLSAYVDEILQNSTSAPYVLRKFYEAFKAYDKKYSMQYFCLKTGMSSKGHFCLMMSGKRPISERYWQTLCEAFKLTDLQTEKFLELLNDSQPYWDRKCS
ncbi:MAG: hypothetical protein EOP48_27715 [Sphingobacteriales bacterium]|nr:MAG: hypothetical protein EOP48_27715 [Sphingobacteriales bacterium]